MVRVFLKGGVWKNSEDEILKAAVQKYGKQQWARVASLLNRKSAKQCKARWHEWLDPSVRKVEWSREEEEKLLHLAKLLPAQWKTIGPLVGRTATQCQEHYERLLDEAATAASGEGGDATASLRSQQQLRPGQIDSHPESKPARPDPIDMDEDEIEMLQEARARLANTQGKKAKRKAREKMLNEAKRLADLQKRRELKQAGLLSSAARQKARKRNREIDLGVEIPFHKPAPAGFHDVTSEDARAEAARRKQMSKIDFKKLNESNYRSRDREAAQAKKREEARLRALERSNMQYVVAQVSKANDPLNIRTRTKLSLPAPSVTDQELAKIAKMEQAAADIADAMDAEGGNAATQALLGDYTDRPLPTPMRTSMQSGAASAMSRQQNIMREASNLRMLERGQTPLLGGEDPMPEDIDEEDMDRKPAARSDASAATPGPDRLGAGRTPSRRDQFRLNRPMSELQGVVTDDGASVGASTFATSGMSIRELAREEKRAAKRARKELEAALSALPAPQFEYELAAPAEMRVDDEEQQPAVVIETVPDAADIDTAERNRLIEEAEKLYEARSSVVKRSDLPRPSGAIFEVGKFAQDESEQLIDNERFVLLRHDAHAFPVAPPADDPVADSGKKSKRKRKKSSELPPETPLDIIPEDLLNDAKELILAEFDSLMEEKVTVLLKEGKAKSESDAIEILVSENERASAAAVSDQVHHPSKGWIDDPTEADRSESLEAECDALEAATAALRRKNDKTQAKLGVLTGGYVKLAETMSAEIARMFADYQNSVIEEAVYKKLQQNEELGASRRLDELRRDIQFLESDTIRMQSEYQALTQPTRQEEEDDDDTE